MYILSFDATANLPKCFQQKSTRYFKTEDEGRDSFHTLFLFYEGKPLIILMNLARFPSVSPGLAIYIKMTSQYDVGAKPLINASSSCRIVLCLDEFMVDETDEWSAVGLSNAFDVRHAPR